MTEIPEVITSNKKFVFQYNLKAGKMTEFIAIYITLSVTAIIINYKSKKNEKKCMLRRSLAVVVTLCIDAVSILVT